jgi:hypothetical protein
MWRRRRPIESGRRARPHAWSPPPCPLTISALAYLQYRHIPPGLEYRDQLHARYCTDWAVMQVIADNRRCFVCESGCDFRYGHLSLLLIASQA